MQKKVMLYLGFLTQFFGITAFSQQQPSLKSADYHTSKSLLWKISGKGLTKPSYIFGTMHAICADDYFFTDKMKSAFEECNQLILEVNLDDPSMTNQYQHQMMLPEGKTLHTYFSNEEEYKIFSARLKEVADIDIELFSHFKPLVLISALSMKGFACEQTSSYEMNLIESAKKNDMTILGLETADSQFEIFDKMKNEEIKRMLTEALQEDSTDTATEAAMIALYKQQDLESLYTLVGSSNEMQDHQDELLTNRNKTWVKNLPALLTSKNSFVAVGAAHLPGETGVLHLLKQAGYTVDAVN